jgi:Domain of unknown function (DUF1996)
MSRFTASVCVALALLVVPTAALTARWRIHGNNFFSNCGFSHRSNDDPIVFPGLPGRSHSHTFFGNRSTNARSTLRSLRAAGTTCKPHSDTAAYWVPTLYLSGRAVKPFKAQLYYVVRAVDRIRAFPAGLRIVAGNSRARRPQSRRVTYWSCGPGGKADGGDRVAGVPNCPETSRRFPRGRVATSLELHVNFPDCWDGRHLDSPDHHSHMAYSSALRCPPSHPVKVPLIRLAVAYPIRGGAGVALSSGGQFSGHADFFNAWNEAALARLVDACFHLRPCRG